MRPLSLRIRLILLITTLMVSGMTIGIGFKVLEARERVNEELESAMELAYQLLGVVFAGVEDGGELEQAYLMSRLQEMDVTRDLDIFLLGLEETIPLSPVVAAGSAAPEWFFSLVHQGDIVRTLPLLDGKRQLVIRCNPAAELNEVWQDTRIFLLVLGGILLLLNVILSLTVGHWLEPVQQIVDGLDSVGQGDYNSSVPGGSLPELRVIADKLNDLNATLRGTQLENRRLAALSLQIQEEERRHLARELHDEMGQALSGIKAIAWSLQQRDEDSLSPLRQGIETISNAAATMSRHIRSLLGRLRPAMLDEMGLVAAVQQLVDQWSQAHTSCQCVCRIAPEFAEVPPDLQIHVYRIVQEVLTNTARYAQASHLQVLMQAAREFSIVVSDDGVGFDPRQQRAGIGLTVMRERCLALGGRMALITQPDAGVRIEIHFPRQNRRDR